MTPEFIAAKTYHRRIGGPDNAFRYSVDFVLSEPDEPVAGPRLLSRNRFNLASIHDQDHGGPRGDGRGANWVRDVLRERGLDDLADLRVLLFAQPRMFGYVFNPVSFWLIVDQDENLRAFIAEVNNTFGDRHSYLCHHDDRRAILPEDTLTAQKVFHVSPFQQVSGTYAFRVDFCDRHIGIRIDHRRGNGGLLATVGGKRAPLKSRDLIYSAIRRPFGSVRVMALIFWQAARLNLKGAPYLARPEPPKSELS